jgi:hypothetical protein
MSFRSSKSAILLAVALVSLAAAGCGSSRDPNWLPVFPATGKVTFQGAAPGGAYVVLHPKQASSPTAASNLWPHAAVEPDGTFKISSYSANDGAPPGDYVVTVEWKKTVKDSRGEPGPGPNVLPAKYAQAATSPITVTIAQGPNQLAPIVLK